MENRTDSTSAEGYFVQTVNVYGGLSAKGVNIVRFADGKSQKVIVK